MKNTLVILILLSSYLSHGQEKTFIKEYTYKASEADSKISCRAIAVNQLRSDLLNDLGVYIESNRVLTSNDIKNKFSQDFTENISTLSAGITKLDILDEKWNGETFWMKASITVDTASLKQTLQKLSEDKQKVKELETLKQQLNDANQNLLKLTEELNAQKELNRKSELTSKYTARINEISVTNSMFNGKAKFESKDYNGAIADFSNVIAINPGYTLAYGYRGHSKMNLRNYADALEDYNKAIELNPTFDAVYVERGWAKSCLGDSRGAIDDFTKAIAISSNYAYAYASRGEEKLKLKDYQSSIEDFSKAVALDPNYGAAYLSRGIAKERLRQSGCTDWKKAAQLDCEPAFELLKKYCH